MSHGLNSILTLPPVTGREYRAMCDKLGTRDAVAELLGCTTAALRGREAKRRPVKRELVLALRYLMIHSKTGEH